MKNYLGFFLDSLYRATGGETQQHDFLTRFYELFTESSTDVAARFHVFPKFPVDYILWLGDSEFPANLTLLVDRSTSDHFSGDAIGVALNLLSRRLCREVPATPSSG